MHNSISLTNISKYFRFAKELALYWNDNYMWNVIYNECSTHRTIEIGEVTRRSSHIKGKDKCVASDKRYSPTLDTSYDAYCAKKTQKNNCTFYRGRVG